MHLWFSMRAQSLSDRLCECKLSLQNQSSYIKEGNPLPHTQASLLPVENDLHKTRWLLQIPRLTGFKLNLLSLFFPPINGVSYPLSCSLHLIQENYYYRLKNPLIPLSQRFHLPMQIGTHITVACLCHHIVTETKMLKDGLVKIMSSTQLQSKVSKWHRNCIILTPQNGSLECMTGSRWLWNSPSKHPLLVKEMVPNIGLWSSTYYAKSKTISRGKRDGSRSLINHSDWSRVAVFTSKKEQIDIVVLFRTCMLHFKCKWTSQTQRQIYP